MKTFIKTMLIILALNLCQAFSKDYIYILDDKCIIDLYENALKHFLNSDIEPIKDSRGIILRYNIPKDENYFNTLNKESLKKIEYFLAKIENPAIIEVHIESFPNNESTNLRKWEISTILANKIEAYITKPAGTVEPNKINSIGYGEFLPAKNTPNNGGKGINRIDIIILCNISGE